jgi:hypothetical protein
MDAGELKVLLESVKADFQKDLDVFEKSIIDRVMQFETRFETFSNEINTVADEVKNLSKSINGVSDRLKVLENNGLGDALNNVETTLEDLNARVKPLEAGALEALHLVDLARAFEKFAPVVNVTVPPVEFNVPEAKLPDLTVLNATLEQFKPQPIDLTVIVKAIQEGFKTPPNITVKLEPPAQMLESLTASQAVPMADSSAELRAVADQLGIAEAAIIERDQALEIANQKNKELYDLVQEVKKQAAALVFEQNTTPAQTETPSSEPVTVEPKTPKKGVK